MQRQPRTKLLTHVETLLGTADSGSVIRATKSDEKYFVTRFTRTPTADATTFMTLGLSEHQLMQPDGRVRQELIFAHYDRFKKMASETLLASVARDCLAEHKALLRGEVLGPADRLGADTEMQALYCSAPSYFPDQLAIFEEPGFGPTVFVWLVPIWESEANFVRANGHERFEELLESSDPDLLDLSRQPVVP